MDAFKSNFIDEFLVLSTGLPQDFGNRDFKPLAEVPCVVEKLCNKHQGLYYVFLSPFLLSNLGQQRLSVELKKGHQGEM